MERARFALCSLAIILSACLRAQADDGNAKAPFTKTDIDIVKRAAQILNSPAKWNRTDNRVCLPDAKAFSLYCALEQATEEAGRQFEHRDAVMEEARSVIEEISPNVHRYSHWLADYNNDPNTNFPDIQGVFWLLEKHIAMRLAILQPNVPAFTKADLQVAKRVRELLDSPAKWNRANTDCVADSKTFSLLCAFKRAEKDVTGTSNDGAALREARQMISELDPSRSKYKSRLADYNSDPAVTFVELQKFLRQLEDRLGTNVVAR